MLSPNATIKHYLMAFTIVFFVASLFQLYDYFNSKKLGELKSHNGIMYIEKFNKKFSTIVFGNKHITGYCRYNICQNKIKKLFNGIQVSVLVDDNSEIFEIKNNGNIIMSVTEVENEINSKLNGFIIYFFFSIVWLILFRMKNGS